MIAAEFGRSPMDLPRYFHLMIPSPSTMNVAGVARPSPKRLYTLYAAGTSVDGSYRIGKGMPNSWNDPVRIPKVVYADGQHLGVQVGDALVFLCQLDELRSAERSPERPVENHRQVFVPPVGLN